MLGFTITVLSLLLSVVGYVLIVRPALLRIPVFRDAIEQADGKIAVVWAYCGKSATMAWGHIVVIVGLGFSVIDKLGPLLGDPDLNLQGRVTDLLKDHPQAAGWIMCAFGVITVAVRLRGLLWSSGED